MSAVPAQGSQERTNAVELDNASMAQRMRKGDRVARGRDWPEGCTDDGQPPRPGTVLVKHGCKVMVQWDNGGSGTYRMGMGGSGWVGQLYIYELKLLPSRYRINVSLICIAP